MDAARIRNLPPQTVVGQAQVAAVKAQRAQKQPGLAGVQVQVGEGRFNVPADGKPLRLGRMPEKNDVRFTESRVSRQHAELKLEGGQLFLQDTHSTFGTTVNGRPVKPGQWVAIKPDDKVELAQVPIGLKEHEPSDSVDFRSGLQVEMKAKGTDPVDVRNVPTPVGRSAENPLTVNDLKVSRYHAELKFEDGQLQVKDRNSLNGTTVEGRPVAHDNWTTITPDMAVDLAGSESIKFQPKLTMPDGRQALVTEQPDGKVRVDKLDFVLSDKELSEFQMNKMGEPRLVQGPEDLKVGENYFSIRGNRIHHLTYYGTDPSGKHRLGHSDTYKPEEFNRYLGEQARYLREKTEARLERLESRDRKAADLRSSEIERLGLAGDLDKPEVMAVKLLAGAGKLAADGRDLWDKEVLDRVTESKRKELAGDPQLSERGLVDLRLEEWLASQRGEMILYRGIRDGYDAGADTSASHYADGLGTALHTYAMKDNPKQATLLVARVPVTDAFRLQRQVGSLPGLNPYAGVVELHPDRVDYPVTPKVVISSTNPKQDWILQEFGKLDDMERESARERFQQLESMVTGK